MTLVQEEALRRSVQEQPTTGETPSSSFFLQLASVADAFPEWGKEPARRDRELRKFFPTEPILMSALYSIVIRNAAFSWTLEGPPRTVKVVQDMLHMADLGRGWLPFITKVGIDLFTQDNGAFIEVIRATEQADSAVVGVSHLDAGRCTRTGDPKTPVLYTDRKGVIHKMEAHQVLPLTEFPSSIETMNGMQYCAVTRILRAAQIMKDISIYQREKIAGDNPNSIYLVGGGISSSEIYDGIVQHKDRQTERGMIRFIIPAVIGSLDPSAQVSVEQIDLKGLPDGFNFEEAMRWYINQLALGFGADYQDFAPLPGKSLGTSTQSLVLHEKSRGRGPALFMKTMEYAFNFHGVIPQNTTFKYDEQDVMADTEQAELNKTRSETITSLVKEGIIDPQAARQIMLDAGDLAPEIFERMNEEDVTPVVTVPDEERVATSSVGTKQEVEQVSDFAEEERLELEAEYERRVGKALDNAFKRAKKIIGVKALRIPSPGQKQGPEELLTDPDFWEEFRVDMVSAAGELARKGALGAAEFNVGLGLAVDMDLVNAEVLDFTRTYTNQWWESVSATTRSNLNQAIKTWQESGLGRRGLPGLVDSIEPMFGKTRAQRIATTEVTRIFDEGNRLAHESAGIEQEEWQTAKDLRVDDICRPLDGKKFPTNGGPRPVTDTHIGCRCARLPVGSDGKVIGK